jgi:uncharacterized membrane protein YhdT
METTNINPLQQVSFGFEEEILKNIDHPKILERLYRKNKTSFERSFNSIYTQIADNSNAQVWNERLNYSQEETIFGNKNNAFFIFLATLITGMVAKIPAFTSVKSDFFYPRNLGFLGFTMLMVYFSWKEKMSIKKIILPALFLILSALHINLLPNKNSDSIILACIHLPIFLWTILGYTFVGGNLKSNQKKMDFLRYNGDFVVMTTIVMLSGFLFSAITIGLFTLIGINIEEFYAEKIAIWGLSAVPIVVTYLVQNNPQLVNKISPTIAKIFTPIVFVTLLIFLATIIYTGKDLYDDRNFLMIFNALLIGVMAIILFSVTEATKKKNEKISLWVLVGLSVLTIILNSLALSAIVFRITEFGITPNRLAVIGANVLIFVNLLFVAYKLLLIARGKSELYKVEAVITMFIPIYGIWAALITFILPLLFHFK